MTTEEKRGRLFVILIGVLYIVPALLRFLAALLRGFVWDPFTAIYLLLPLGIAWFLLRGHQTARYFMALAFSLVALRMVIVAIAVFFVELSTDDPGGTAEVVVRTLIAILSLLGGALHGWAAWALWVSPSIEAYVEQRRRQREPIVSIYDDRTPKQ